MELLSEEEKLRIATKKEKDKLKDKLRNKLRKLKAKEKIAGAKETSENADSSEGGAKTIEGKAKRKKMRKRGLVEDAAPNDTPSKKVKLDVSPTETDDADVKKASPDVEAALEVKSGLSETSKMEKKRMKMKALSERTKLKKKLEKQLKEKEKEMAQAAKAVREKEQIMAK